MKELERIYGVRDGSANEKGSIVGEINSFTQKDLADSIGIEVRTLQNYKQLADMIPEMQDLVETGIVTPTTARAIPFISGIFLMSEIPTLHHLSQNTQPLTVYPDNMPVRHFKSICDFGQCQHVDVMQIHNTPSSSGQI